MILGEAIRVACTATFGPCLGAPVGQPPRRASNAQHRFGSRWVLGEVHLQERLCKLVPCSVGAGRAPQDPGPPVRQRVQAGPLALPGMARFRASSTPGRPGTNGVSPGFLNLGLAKGNALSLLHWLHEPNHAPQARQRPDS